MDLRNEMNYRKPDDLKVLHGTGRKDRDAGNESHEVIELTDLEINFRPPSILGTDAKRKWKELIPLLNEHGLLDQLYRGSLEACCVAYGDFCEAQKTIKELMKEMKIKKEEISLIVDPKERANKINDVTSALKSIGFWKGEKNDAMKMYLSYMKEFGLSPAAQSKIGSKKKESKPSEFERFKAKQSV